MNNTTPFFLKQKNLNIKTCLFENLVLCGDWNFNEKKPINTEVKFTKNVEYKDYLKFQNKKIAQEYCLKVNSYGYKMEVTNQDSEWELKINEFKKQH